MTALAKDIKTPRLGDSPLPTAFELPVVASDILYAGAMIVINASGYAAPAGSTGNIDGARVVGRCEKQVDNSSGSAGALTARVVPGCFRYANSSSTDALTDADIGRPCFVVDDATVARTSNRGTRTRAGKVVEVDSDGVWVELGFTSQEDGSRDVMIVAGADLSAKQFYAVKLSTNALDVAGAGETCVGILQNAPANGAIGIVRVSGESKMIAGGALATTGVAIASNGSGKAKAAAGATVNTSDAGSASDAVVGSYALGILTSTAAADGDTVTVIVTHSGAVPTTAALARLGQLKWKSHRQHYGRSIVASALSIAKATSKQKPGGISLPPRFRPPKAKTLMAG